MKVCEFMRPASEKALFMMNEIATERRDGRIFLLVMAYDHHHVDQPARAVCNKSKTRNVEE